MTVLFSVLQGVLLLIPVLMANGQVVRGLYVPISPVSLRRGLIGERYAFAAFAVMLFVEFGLAVNAAELPVELLPSIPIVGVRALTYVGISLISKALLHSAVRRHNAPRRKAAIARWLGGDDLPTEEELRDRVQARAGQLDDDSVGGQLAMAPLEERGRLTEVEQ